MTCSMQQLLLLTKSENPDSTPKPSGERPAHHPELAPWPARTRHEESTVITAPARGSDASTPDELVSALLTASRALVGVSARSLAHVEDAVTITQFRTLVVLEGHGDTRLNQLAERLAATGRVPLDRRRAGRVQVRIRRDDLRPREPFPVAEPHLPPVWIEAQRYLARTEYDARRLRGARQIARNRRVDPLIASERTFGLLVVKIAGVLDGVAGSRRSHCVRPAAVAT